MRAYSGRWGSMKVRSVGVVNFSRGVTGCRSLTERKLLILWGVVISFRSQLSSLNTAAGAWNWQRDARKRRPRAARSAMPTGGRGSLGRLRMHTANRRSHLGREAHKQRRRSTLREYTTHTTADAPTSETQQTRGSVRFLLRAPKTTPRRGSRGGVWGAERHAAIFLTRSNVESSNGSGGRRRRIAPCIRRWTGQTCPQAAPRPLKKCTTKEITAIINRR